MSFRGAVLGAVLLAGILVLAKSAGWKNQVPVMEENGISVKSSRVVTRREAGSDLFLDFEERIWGS